MQCNKHEFAKAAKDLIRKNGPSKRQNLQCQRCGASVSSFDVPLSKKKEKLDVGSDVL